LNLKGILGVGVKKRLAIAATVIAVLVIIAVFLLSQGGTFQALAKGSIIVTLTDEETGKPIGKVDSGYVRVVLGGIDQGYLTDEGELKIEGVEPDTHELLLIIPHYGEKRQFVEVGSGQTVPVNIVVDMPNPIFDVTIGCKTGLDWFDEVGDISVTLTNRGDVASRSTSVLVIVYKEDDTSTPIATHMLDFPSLVSRQDGGISHTLSWRCTEFVWGPKEVITAVVFDGWAYTPQNEQVVSVISAPNSMVNEISYSVANYLKNRPDLIVNTVAKIMIGWFG
jgi:hypothetical protein